MSSDLVLQATNVSKQYLLYDKPSDRLLQFLLRGQRNFYRTFSALDGVSFEMRRGETVGVLGRNGAGKSTLLQIICGTVSPTAGEVKVNGRISALLELGAGFSPDFTGRENVFLNATILGLSHEETLARFDEIVAFADIGPFLDQPVKTYSSGMYMRLAFAVAVHVSPDILIVDEALAVGDAPFQAKCIARIRQLVDRGASLLFVSHDLGAVKALCSKALLLDKGRQLAWGASAPVADEYVKVIQNEFSGRFDSLTPTVPKAQSDDDVTSEPDRLERFGNGKARYSDIRIHDASGKVRDSFSYGETIEVRTVVEIKTPLRWLGFGIHLRDRNGVDIGYNDCVLEGHDLYDVEAGDMFEMCWRLPATLANGPYHISCVLSSPTDEAEPPFSARNVAICDFVSLAAHFRVGGEALLFGYQRVGALASVVKLTRAPERRQPQTAGQG